MGTEVLRSHDCLSRVRHHAHAGSRRSPRPTARTTRHGAARRGQAAAASTPVPREVRVKTAADTAYAGPAFGAMSPSPRALPLPRFSFSKTAVAAAPTVDDSATLELRRLLGLERPETN